MHRPRRWNLAPAHADAAEMASRLKVSPLVAQILLSRGYTEVDACRDFLSPNLKCLHAPALIPNLTKAAERIAKAIRDREKIVIYGDYDVDGITATSILWHAIKVLGGEADYYIPHRIDEGYGLNAEALAQICDSGAKLIVTVDCGVTAIEPAKVARERGVDLIVTDHHEWREGILDFGLRILDLEGSAGDGSISNPKSKIQNPKSQPLLPDCFTVVHPRLPTDGFAYPNPHLCGAGVAFKLAWGIGLAMTGTDRVSDDFRKFLLDATALCALGTIADVVPLVGENRILAHFGLTGLRNSKLAGLQALIASAGLTGRTLESFDVGFKLAPRLNACGRMGHAARAVEMLTRADADKAAQIADFLEGENRQRQAVEKKIVDQAIAQVMEQGGPDKVCALVVAKEEWHAGVIGIVASRLVDKFHRPTVMIALNNGHGQGSARSIAGFHLARALDACGEHLEAHGGHEMAAGLKLETAKLDDFRAAFCAYASSQLRPDDLIPELALDASATLDQLTEALVKDLHRLGPFGHANRKPLLCCRDLQLTAPARRVGASGDHLQIHIRQGERLMKCIAFGYGPMEAKLSLGTRIDLAVEPQLNEFNGRTNVELIVRDLVLLADTSDHIG
jgi:single-stranded-DNA-specific exonuclease